MVDCILRSMGGLCIDNNASLILVHTISGYSQQKSFQFISTLSCVNQPCRVCYALTDQHSDSIRFAFGQLIQKELDDFVKEWNHHHIRSSSMAETPSGKPEVLYNFPALHGTYNLHDLYIPLNNLGNSSMQEWKIVSVLKVNYLMR